MAQVATDFSHLAELIETHNNTQQQHALPPSQDVNAGVVGNDDFSFLFGDESDGQFGKQLSTDKDRILAQISEYKSQNRWQDIIDLCHPMDERCADLVEYGLANGIYKELAFALSKVQRHYDAINYLKKVIQSDDTDSLAHYSLGYVASDLLLFYRNERKAISSRQKAEMLELAHRHFGRAISLRPDSVTFCYREAILYKEIDNKPLKAEPLFRRAINNWQKMSDEQKRDFHQQRPKYMKALYHFATCLREQNKLQESLEMLQTLLEEDRAHNHIAPLFKLFSTGKTLSCLGDCAKSNEYLRQALQQAERSQQVDFVLELLARNHHRLGNFTEGVNAINKIPERRHLPYIVWTRADLLAASGQVQAGINILQNSASRDRRSRHKSMIKICKLELKSNHLPEALTYAENAIAFYQEIYGNPCYDALFWKAVCLYRSGNQQEARKIAEGLANNHYMHQDLPNFIKLLNRKEPAPQANKNQQSKGSRNHIHMVK